MKYETKLKLERKFNTIAIVCIIIQLVFAFVSYLDKNIAVMLDNGLVWQLWVNFNNVVFFVCLFWNACRGRKGMFNKRYWRDKKCGKR